jgi:serine/threonine protein kinase
VSRKDIENETTAIQKLCDGAHENIIHVLGIGEFEHNNATYIYIDMEVCQMTLSEFIEGRDMWGWILFDHPYDSSIIAECTTWNIMTQISGGLIFVHSRSIIHRDLKPQNGEARFPWCNTDFKYCSQAGIISGNSPISGFLR